MQDNYNSKGKHLTASERQLIERWHNKDKLSNREIAYRLGKAPQTINNEVKRGTVQRKTKRKYSSKLAQATYKEQRVQSKRPTKLTAEIDKTISQAVKAKISLEVIHQEIKSVVCLRTLYNWMTSGILSVAYHELLYPQYRKSKKQRVTQPKHKLGLSIEERPKSINERSEYGHWEIDTVLLTKEKGECLLTLTERKTRLEIIRLIPDKTTHSVNQALRQLNFSALSVTSDNGKEFAKLSEVLECPVYYCHAYVRHERGTNENHNRMIRRHLPKGTKKTTKQFVAYIENWMNNYPRKMFNFKSPNQMLIESI
ncbi:IS30 family transposase [Lactococcus garvieae subsp. garvieae]|uniref:IS30 family transposase n=1 Tax=Lactococcus garvieae TaxID=1363 RepID=UPI0005AB1D4F|nr:IS30 family transposase [Lactococcus garvieae]KAA8713364.1 IS30 family transposase [Lactococcus garvieae subsp. garvieae]MDG6192356.1 IS30 family transposase [Lactococcus garvieae]QPR48055.1 IS30 family transposase [Lactococcus garvieae]